MKFHEILFICIHLLSILLKVNSYSIEENISVNNVSDDTIDDGRVIGGRDAFLGEVPYQIALLSNNRFICGGFLVRPNAVLTAAHCVHGASSNTEFKIRYNTLQYSNGPTIKVKRVIAHPRYNPQRILNDIAILILETSFSPDVNAMSIDVSSSSDPRPNSLVTVSGWGRVSPASNEISSTLKVANLTVISERTCSEYWAPMVITKNQICAADPTRSACNGDSGGPLVQKGNIVGIVSFGSSQCLHDKLPNVYTKVSAYSDWIRSNLKRYS